MNTLLHVFAIVALFFVAVAAATVTTMLVFMLLDWIKWRNDLDRFR